MHKILLKSIKILLHWSWSLPISKILDSLVQKFRRFIKIKICKSIYFVLNYLIKNTTKFNLILLFDLYLNETYVHHWIFIKKNISFALIYLYSNWIAMHTFFKIRISEYRIYTKCSPKLFFFILFFPDSL